MSFRNQRWLGPVFLTLLLGACGGGNSLLASSGGTGGTGMSGGTGGSGMSIGSITQFGSVFVNGVEYHISGAAISTENGTQLATGMVVAVDYTNGTTATSVTFTDDLLGTVDSNGNHVNVNGGSGSLTVLGQTVLISKDTVFEGDAGYPTIDTVPAGAVVQVSGYTNGASGTIHASLVRLVSDSWSSGSGPTLELKGVIRSLDTPTAGTFRIGTLTVDYSSAGSIISNLQNGVYVKVESTQGYNGSGQLIVSAIALSNGGVPGVDAANGTHLTLGGVVTTALNSANNQFVLNGQTVQVGTQTTYPNGDSSGIQLNAQLTVQGNMSKGVLVANTITFTPSDSSLDTLGGYVEVVNTTNSTLQLMGQTIYVNNDTIFVDDTGASGKFNLDAIHSNSVPSDHIVADVYYDTSTGQWLATKVEREAIQSSPVWSLEGSVTNVLPTGQLVVAGGYGGNPSRAGFFCPARAAGKR